MHMILHQPLFVVGLEGPEWTSGCQSFEPYCRDGNNLSIRQRRPDSQRQTVIDMALVC